jgi:site-specific DNA-methyltransferase (adenine-specific)/modification methylase
MPEPYYRDEQVTIYNCDWREVVTQVAPDLVLTDPPYGINAVGKTGVIGGASSERVRLDRHGRAMRLPAKRQYQKVVNDHSTEEAKAAVEALCLTPKQIWWGANHYGEALGDATGWLVWDKETNGDFADCELAWTNLPMAVRIYRHLWNGMMRASERGMRWHPNQKPVALMDWCLVKAKLEPSSLVFDPFMGGGPVAVAAKAQGHRYIGCDVVEEYCEIAAQRCQQAYLGI